MWNSYVGNKLHGTTQTKKGSKKFAKHVFTCEGNVGARENVGGGVGLNVGQRGWHKRGESVQPDNTTLKKGS